ncbi:MAG: aconitate hydratase AcnA [Pseudomonadota bacterium]
MTAARDSFDSTAILEVGARRYRYFSLERFAAASGLALDALPISHRVLLENLLRCEDGEAVTREDILALAGARGGEREIAFAPARVLMQDFTGVPGVVDLAALRDAVAARGGDPQRVNPLVPVDLVIDHSVMVDHYADAGALRANVALEMARNAERYRFLRWGQSAFDNFRVVPPGTGICHQVNLEYLARCVWTREQGGATWAYPDTLVGTDSHTTMINGIGVLGWGVGGIEAEAAMLGQPISMLIPAVVGVRLEGRLRPGVTATDLVLTVTELLRRHQVVGKFVEFCGPGLDGLPVADRATLANMAPEYGATCGFFPIDRHTLDYLELTGRDAGQIALVEAYARAQGLWRDPQRIPHYGELVALDLDKVVPAVAGPRRPQDLVPLAGIGRATREAIELRGRPAPAIESGGDGAHPRDGDLVIAAITSCTNTSNPAVMLAAGLVARKAVALGLRTRPWVKTSLAPGSKVVTEYLRRSGLQPFLDQLGFHLVGYGCTTCIGNSGPLPAAVDAAIEAGDLTVGAVLSGNRNFEGRIHPRVRVNWLASPPLVVAFALAGTTLIDPTRDPLAFTPAGAPVRLADLWPDTGEIAAALAQVERALFVEQYARVFEGDDQWRALEIPEGATYRWDADSTYIQRPPFFDAGTTPPADAIRGARLLALLGDSVTTDHISPAGSIAPDSPAGRYLRERGVAVAEFNSYGARRGNHEIMMRGTFANVRIRNELLPGVEGGYTRMPGRPEPVPIYDAAMAYAERGTPLVVIAGREYGTGSSRDWAAKGTRLLGVRAVIAESFERIHRSNLVGMGVLPLEFAGGLGRAQLGLDGSELFHLEGLAGMAPGQALELVVERADGRRDRYPVRSRIDTANELRYYRAGGILHHMLDQLAR